MYDSFHPFPGGKGERDARASSAEVACTCSVLNLHKLRKLSRLSQSCRGRQSDFGIVVPVSLERGLQTKPVASHVESGTCAAC